MSPNVSNFEWTTKRDHAAILLAEDQLSDEVIAAKVGIDRRTLTRWKEHPEFKARICANVEQLRASAFSEGVADKTNRLRALNDRWKRMNHLLRIREEETSADVTGADTGLLVRREKETKYGTNVEFEVDTGLLAEIRAVEQQAAKELGQWTEKQEVSIGDGGIIDSLEQKLVRLAERTGPQGLSSEPDGRGSDGTETPLELLGA